MMRSGCWPPGPQPRTLLRPQRRGPKNSSSDRIQPTANGGGFRHGLSRYRRGRWWSGSCPSLTTGRPLILRNGPDAAAVSMRRADRCGACSDMCSGAVRCRGLSPLRKQPHSPGSAPGRRQMQGLPASHARCALARGRRDVHSYKGVVSTSQGNPWFPCPAHRGRKAAGRGNGTGRLRRGTRVGLRSARLLRGSVRARRRGAPGHRQRGRPDRTALSGERTSPRWNV